MALPTLIRCLMVPGMLVPDVIIPSVIRHFIPLVVACLTCMLLPPTFFTAFLQYDIYSMCIRWQNDICGCYQLRGSCLPYLSTSSPVCNLSRAFLWHGAPRNCMQPLKREHSQGPFVASRVSSYPRQHRGLPIHQNCDISILNKNALHLTHIAATNTEIFRNLFLYWCPRHLQWVQSTFFNSF
jgi:hypothetical protein